MYNLLILAISLSFVDSFNPFTISTQVVLQELVKKTYHILYYILGTFISYLIGGFLVYWGFDKVISALVHNIMSENSTLIFSLEVALGIILIIGGIFLLYRRLKTRKKPIKARKTASNPKSVNRVFLFLLGASNTVGDLPTAIPYFLFIGKIVQAKLSIIDAVILLVIYSFIYVLPLIVIFFLYLFSKKKIEVIIEKIKPMIVLISK